MNREIKFRVFDKSKKVMEFAGAIDWTENEKIISINTATQKHYSYQALGNQPDDFVLMQFTGIKDKNGKEIYEGDIVKTTRDTEYGKEDFNEEVYFGGGAFYPISTQPSETWEVIGNIYENLIKSKM